MATRKFVWTLLISVAPCAGLAADDAAPPALAGITDTTPASAPVGATSTRKNPLGVSALSDRALARQSGGTDTGPVSEMKLRGTVSDTSAINVSTGNNLITEGALSNTSGIPMVIQNSGNNVLIQNATIVNIQLK
ncbi:MAG: hypothetical protein RR784_02505 [Burkholderiaceae bacterium]